MPHTHYGTNDLIMAPERSTQTFPSGLVRVERRYVCRKENAAIYRAELAVGNALPEDDGAPAIDGLYIYPEPQEQLREDGFLEFRVTAYGRSNVFSINGITRQLLLAQYFYYKKTYDSDGILTQSLSQEKTSFNEVFTILGVLPASDTPTSLFVAPSISNPLVIPTDTEVPLAHGVQTITTATSSVVRQTNIYLIRDLFESKNFGHWAEYTVVWKVRATVSDTETPL